jgi:hypothetical protein
MMVKRDVEKAVTVGSYTDTIVRVSCPAPIRCFFHDPFLGSGFSLAENDILLRIVIRYELGIFPCHQ